MNMTDLLPAAPLPSTCVLYHGDCLEVMPTLKPKSVDMVFADLPYGVLAIDWDRHVALDKVFYALRQVQNEVYTSCFTATHPYAVDLINANRTMFRYDLIWHKARATNFMLARTRPMRSHESILVFGSKNSTYNAQKTQGTPTPERPRTASCVYPLRGKSPSVQKANIDGMKHPRTVLSFIESDTYSSTKRLKMHPTQKPVALLEWLIKTYTNKGDTVLDPVFGSNTTAVACARLGRHYIGIEKDAEYFRIGKERVDMERAKLGLAPSTMGV